MGARIEDPHVNLEQISAPFFFFLLPWISFGLRKKLGSELYLSWKIVILVNIKLFPYTSSLEICSCFSHVFNTHAPRKREGGGCVYEHQKAPGPAEGKNKRAEFISQNMLVLWTIGYRLWGRHVRMPGDQDLFHQDTGYFEQTFSQWKECLMIIIATVRLGVSLWSI